MSGDGMMEQSRSRVDVSRRVEAYGAANSRFPPGMTERKAKAKAKAKAKGKGEKQRQKQGRKLIAEG
jgi:hypothetical protein